VTAEAATTAAAEAGITSAQPLDSDAGRFHREAARARAGELFTEHATLIQRICSRLLRDDFEAEDAAQQTFLSAYKAMLTGAEPRDGEAWLATIARNECLQRIRARMRRPLPVLEHDVDDGRPDVHHLAVDRLNAARLWREISSLPPQQRDAVILREVAGLSYDELALLLGVTRPSVESLLFRARGRLRTRLRTALASVNLAGLASEAAAAIARLGGQAAAPLAVKAAAVGVGVAVVGGGGLVAEQRLEPRQSVDLPAVAAAAPARRVPRPATTRPARVVPPATRPAATPVAAGETERGHDGDGRAPRERETRTEHGGREHDGRDGGGEATRLVAAEETVPHPEATTAAPATTSSSGGDGPGGGDVRLATQPAPATTDGHDGGHDGDGATSTAATTTTATTTTSAAATTSSDGGGHDGGGTTSTTSTTDGHDGGSGSDGGTSGPD
jgi:RNA polymerase sigma-70 factor, ECF subfamily